jgi:hypothetical protein
MQHTASVERVGGIADRCRCTSVGSGGDRGTGLKPIEYSNTRPSNTSPLVLGQQATAMEVIREKIELEAHLLNQNQWLLALDDIHNAFPTVIIADLLADHAHYITDSSLLSLIVVLSGNDEKPTRGIVQGSPYSPSTLNARLHHALDLGANRDHHPLRYWRYADHLIYLYRSVPKGNQAVEYVHQLLRSAYFALEGADGVFNLQQGVQAQLLGFSIAVRKWTSPDQSRQ